MKSLNLLIFVLAPFVLRAQVDFASQVHPILASRCAGCHTGPGAQAGLRVDDRASMERVKTMLLPRVRGQEGLRMPPSGAPLSEAQIATLEKWVDAGLPWTDVKAQAADTWKAPLEPRNPGLPASSESNPVDKFVDVYYRAHKLTWLPPVDDAHFARRAYLDLWGIMPTYEQARAFTASKDPAKRAKLVDTLLADRQATAGHWVSFWNDLLRNDQLLYHGGSKQITGWLKAALQENMPYDEMVRQLINPVGKDAPEGFLMGINWRGDVNASQLPHMQAAQNTAQVFLGVNLKCASCHDSFINRYKLRQSYGMAAIFAEQPRLELVRCDVKMGQYQEPEFLFPEVGSIPQGAPLSERRAAAASLFTSPQNGRLARTFVNRIWARLFGRGIVENVDDMDARPWNADLLDWLASDFASNGYDVHRLLRTLMTSRAWQQPAANPPKEPGKEYMFRGPVPRRLTAEQFVDTLSSITGEWRMLQQVEGGARFAREWEFKSTPLSRALGRPIRDQVYTTRNEESSTLQALELVNGSTLALSLRRGAQRLTGQLPEAAVPLFDSKVLRAKANSMSIDIPLKGAKELWLLVEDTGSYDAERSIAGWEGLKFDTGQTVQVPTTRSITVDKQPVANVWQTPFGKAILVPVEPGATRLTGRVLIDDSGKLSDINTAARFYIFPKPPDRNLLTPATAPPPFPLPASVRNPGQIADRLFWQTLGRAPDLTEKQLALATLQQPTGLEDLLWTLLLHPEFQYVK